jgi:hypothetical protein
MKNDGQIGNLQNNIGQVQSQMKENIELVIQREDNLNALSNKSSNLQQSASQFSQVASRIREDQQMQKYKFYAGITFGISALIILIAFWHRPGTLFVSLLIIIGAAATVFYLFNARRQNTLVLAETASLRAHGDVETGRSSE